ncbi:MAG: hypothetical protein FD129_60 [bacterium]|nr:MAG: hypothetical protein FD129_60 [bacterium]
MMNVRQYLCRAVRSGALASMVALIVCGWCVPSHATSHGPQVVDVLGFDSSDRRVYFTISPGVESDTPPAIYYISLADSAVADTPVRIPELPRSRTRLEETMQRIDVLRARLSFLGPITGESAYGDSTETYVRVVDTAIVSPDSTESDIRVTRFHLDVWFRQDEFVARRTFTAWDRPGGRVIQWLETPRADIRLAVFGFIGIPVETGYERQEVIVLRRR